MKRSLKRFFSMILVASTLLSMASCSASEAPETAAEKGKETVAIEDVGTTLVTETVETEEVVPVSPYSNPLTGLPCEEAVSTQRPVAVMLNNIKEALPQAGLSSCDIIYEVLAEGGIIRLVGLFQDYAAVPKIGSVRSARPYYVHIAASYDAIYAHVGGSEEGKSEIKRLGVDNLDGLIYDGSVFDGIPGFYRDQNRLNAGVSYEHTMFTSGQGLLKIIQARGYETKRSDTSFTAFAFDPAFKSLNGGTSATYVKIPHSNYSVSEFRYNESDGKYYHSQYNEPHIDSTDGAQVATENVFILLAEQKVIDSYGRLSTKLTGEGQGYYLTGGKVVSITWKRQSDNDSFSYYNADGTELSVRCGRSYVSVADTDIANLITIS